ncbi:MAG TPA: hypothetical protein VLA87_10510 [Gaiellaceae bacterium]|nr:hypothetical protein [Gaiellaceae bacterium]
MSRLFLFCGLCGRQQADGLLSRGYWGHLDVGNGHALRACPACKEQYADWEARLRANASPNALDLSAFPYADGSQGLT